MANDQFGRPVKVGDQVTIKGEVVDVSEEITGFINCVVKLAQKMPSGTEVKVQLNTAQVETQGGGAAAPRAAAPQTAPTQRVPHIPRR